MFGNLAVSGLIHLGLKLTPCSSIWGKLTFFLQHTEEALDWFLKARAANPNFPRTLAWTTALYAQKGDSPKAHPRQLQKS
jgi:hypothetical protein